MRISTMPMFLGCGLAAFVLDGGPTFATEITIHDSPGREYVITVDPASDKPAADPAPQGKQRARRIKITKVDNEKGKELPKAMLGPYNVAVSEGAKGDGTNRRRQGGPRRRPPGWRTRRSGHHPGRTARAREGTRESLK
jgi:hypothetical protein